MEKEQKDPQEYIRFRRATRTLDNIFVSAQIFFIAMILMVVLVVWLAPMEYRLYAGFALGFAGFICTVVTVIFNYAHSYERKRYEKWWSDALLEMYIALDKATNNPCPGDAEANIALFAWAKKLSEDYAPSAAMRRAGS